MSLLLDALKRAEEAKRAKQLDAQGAPGAAVAPAQSPPQPPQSPSLTLEEVPRAPPVASTPPISPAQRQAPRTSELALEPVASPAGTPAPAAKAAPLPRAAARAEAPAARVDPPAARDAARVVTAAKQSAAADGPSRNWLLPVIAVVIVVLGAGGWFVWKEVARLAQPQGLRAPPAPGTVAAGVPAAQPAPPPVVATPRIAEAALPPLLPPAPEAQPVVAAVRSAPVELPADRLARSLRDTPDPAPKPPEIRLAPAPVAIAVRPEVEAAYAALKRGDYARAREAYAGALASDPQNLDALLGMGTVLARQGDIDAAARRFREVLVIDPRNGPALAGLAAIGIASNGAGEVELRVLLGRHPEDAALHFLLGNLLASQQRWVEAQQAYFDAFRLAPDNADHAYNLAVSLERIRQPRLARDYYLKAIALQPRSGGQFDLAAAQRRAASLAASLAD